MPQAGLQDQLEQRIRRVEAADGRVEQLDGGDYGRLLAVCVAVPALLLIVGWFL